MILSRLLLKYFNFLFKQIDFFLKFFEFPYAGATAVRGFTFEGCEFDEIGF